MTLGREICHARSVLQEKHIVAKSFTHVKAVGFGKSWAAVQSVQRLVIGMNFTWLAPRTGIVSVTAAVAEGRDAGAHVAVCGNQRMFLATGRTHRDLKHNV
jgi:cytidylate kinase